MPEERLPLIAGIAETPREIEQLFSDKPLYWEWATFVSLLLQRRNALDRLAEEHQQSWAPASGLKIADFGELSGLVEAVVDDVWRQAQDLEKYVVSEPFVSIFDSEAHEPSPERITAAADRLANFYKANLLLARRTRGTTAPAEYRNVIEDTAHLVDPNLAAIDRLISDAVGFVTMFPTMERNLHGRREFHTIPLVIQMDSRRLSQILRQLKRLRQPWRRWLWPW